MQKYDESKVKDSEYLTFGESVFRILPSQGITQPGAPLHIWEEGGDREIFDQHNWGGGGGGGQWGQPRPMMMQ